MKELKKSTLLISALMIGAIFSAPVMASGLEKITNINGGNGGGTSNASTIYFGKYWQSYKGSGETSVLDNYNKEGIKWRVLENDTSGSGTKQMLILADKALYADKFDSSGLNVWKDSEIRATLNNTTADSGFSGDAFSIVELAAIAETTHTAGGSFEGSDIQSTEKLFILSEDEAQNASYGFSNNTSRQATATDMANNVKMYGNDKTLNNIEHPLQWLRSPGITNEYVYNIYNDGSLADNYKATNSNIAVRPALNLDQDSVLFASAAVGGKSSVNVGDGFAIDNAYDGSSGWKLTLADTNIAAPTNVSVEQTTTGGVDALAEAAPSGGTLDLTSGVTVSYSNPIVKYTAQAIETGTANYVSAIAKDSSGNYVNYAKISDQVSETGKEVGLGNLADGTYKMFIFAEQANGDYQTDYASAFSNTDGYEFKKGSGTLYSSKLSKIYANKGLTADLGNNFNLSFDAGEYDTSIDVSADKTGKITADATDGTTLTGDISVGDGATLTTANTFTLKGNINGTGTGKIDNTGTLKLSNNTINTTIDGTGTTDIESGTVNAAKDITQNNINVKLGATLSSTANDVRIAASDTFINNGTVNMSGDDSKLLAVNLNNNGTIDAVNVIANTTLTNNGTINATGIEVGTLLTNNSTIEADIILATKITNDGNITTTDTMFGDATNNSGASLTVNGKINSSMYSPTILINEGNVTINGDEIKRIQLSNSGIANINGKLDGVFVKQKSKIQLIQNNGGVMNFSTNAIESTANLPIDTFQMNGGLVNIADGSVNTLHINQLNLAGNTNFAMDADFAAGNMDKIQIHDIDNSEITAGKVININKINLLSDATQEKINLSIFADDATKDALIGNVNANINGLQYSPIYKYDALYNPETGMIGFTRYNSGGYDDLNPAVMAGAVSAQVGGYLNQLTSYDNAFEHIDSYMNMTRSQRTAMKMLNRYAASGTNLGTYNPNQLADETRGIWFKPYATFEKVNLKGGPNVENTAYGSFLGGDSDLIELRNGWDMIYSAYASYDGSHQNYDGVSVYQNGGHLGGTATWYKGNFFSGLTANVGASVAEASTMYGTDNMTMLMAGIANKTGYNWELLNSKLIVQPSLLMSYSFVNTFDYTNAAGVNIDSDPLHAIQIAPGLKFIGNLPHGWQPYLGVQMVWNIMDETKFKAANVNLPQLSTRPYFQYGIGVQKKWGDRFSGYLQAMLRNGGRTGIALSAGFRWALGKDVKNPDSIKTSNSVPELPKTKIKLSSIK